MVVEPAGAASVAALRTGAVTPTGPTVAILSGGNIDPMLLLRVIEHGLASAGRFLRLSVRCGDRPGELARLLARIAEQRANIVDVAHSRQNPRLRFGEVEVALSVETRGPDHSAALMGMLREAGYPVALLSGAAPS
jgi:threonine dehydratase